MDTAIFLHVGYPKTGSTFLQEEVFTRMLDVRYVRYTNCPDAFNDIMYSDEYHYDGARTASQMKEQCAQGKNIISHEHFIGGDFALDHFMNGKNIAHRLHGLFPNAKVLFVIRNQYDLAISFYKQYIQRGGRKPLHNFLHYHKGKGMFDTIRKKWMPGITVNQLDYKPAIDNYARLFGKENILVLPYELLAKNNTAFVQNIARWMGVSADIAFSNRIRNRGYGARQIALARVLNRFVRSPFNESPLIPNVAIPGIGNMDAFIVRKVLQSKLSFALLGNKKIIDEPLRHDLFEYFAKSNKELCNTYNLQLDTLCPNLYF